MGRFMTKKAYLTRKYGHQKNMLIRIGGLIALLLSFYSPIVLAADAASQPAQPPTSFYVFQIPTENQSVVEREKQIREAFQVKQRGHYWHPNVIQRLLQS